MTESAFVAETAGFPIYFHLGAHKTATTYVQELGRINRDVLLDNGILYCNLWENTEDKIKLRQALELSIWHEKAQYRHIVYNLMNKVLLEEYRAAKVREIKYCLLSLENVSGCYDLKETRSIYPTIGLACKILKQIFRDRGRMIFVMRNYAEFVESTFLQLLETRGKHYEFFDYIAELDFDDLDWRRVAADIRKVFPDDTAVIRSYEDLKADPSGMLRLFFADTPQRPGWSVPEGTINWSYSEKSMKIAQKVNPILESQEERILLRQFLKSWIDQRPGYTRPKLLPPMLKTALGEKYARDLSEIAA